MQNGSVRGGGATLYKDGPRFIPFPAASLDKENGRDGQFGNQNLLRFSPFALVGKSRTPAVKGAMLSYETYKTVHLLGVITLVVGLGGLIVHYAQGGESKVWRRRLAITHGLGLVMILVAGFGLLAKLHLMASLPGWAIGKVVIWLLLGGIIALIRRKPALATFHWWATIGLATLAAYLAVFKPF